MSVPSVDKSSDTVKSTGVVFSWVWKIDSITDHYLFWGAGPEAELPVSSQWEFIASLVAWMSTVNSCQASAFRSKLPIIAALTPFPRFFKKTGDVYLDSDSSLIVATQLGIFIVSSVFAPINGTFEAPRVDYPPTCTFVLSKRASENSATIQLYLRIPVAAWLVVSCSQCWLGA